MISTKIKIKSLKKMKILLSITKKIAFSTIKKKKIILSTAKNIITTLKVYKKR